MARLGPYLASWSSKGGELAGYYFWCPACQQPHEFLTRNKSSAHCWEFNGDIGKPTFKPSLLLWAPMMRDGEEVQPPVRLTKCHCIVTDGQIYYCADQPGGWAGKTVPMEPIPDTWHLGGCNE